MFLSTSSRETLSLSGKQNYKLFPSRADIKCILYFKPCGDFLEDLHVLRPDSTTAKLTGEANFFLAKPHLSLSRMRTIIPRENFRISQRKKHSWNRPLSGQSVLSGHLRNPRG